MKKSPQVKAKLAPEEMKCTEEDDFDFPEDDGNENEIRIIFFGEKEKRGGSWVRKDDISGRMLGKERREVKREARRIEKIWEAMKKRKGG